MKLAGLPGGDGWSRSYQCVFGGLNRTLAAGDGEIQDMENMTGDHYPLLSPRERRYTVRTLTKPHGLGGEDKLCWVDGTDFYYDGTVKGQVADSDKQFLFLNRWVVIWPDKKYYNTATGQFGSLEAEVQVDGVVQKAHFLSSAAPGGISSDANCLVLDSTTVQGVFRPGDGLTISGCTVHPENNKTLVVRQVVGTALYFYDNSFTMDTCQRLTVGAEGLASGDYNMCFEGFSYHAMIPAMTEGDSLVYADTGILTANVGGVTQTLTLEAGAFGTDWLVFEDPENIDYAEPGQVTVRRCVPDMDYLCQCDNRLWGVKDTMVYCSYLGEPRVWYNYDATAAACWSVETGGGAAFTGAYTYGGYPLLFKENHIYRVYGTKPSNYQLMDTETLGCEPGSSKSFAVVGQTLYYKSRAGFVAYSGGIPAIVDSALGNTRRQNAVAGTDGRKYYVSVKEGQGREIFVYDTVLGLWHREDSIAVKAYAWCGGELYMLTESGKLLMTGRIRTPSGTAEVGICSAAEFADFYVRTVDRKLLTRLYLRVQTTGRLRLLVSWDGGPWQECGCVSGQSQGISTMQVLPRRCDRFRIRLEGDGDWKLWAMGREYATGTTRG